MVTKDELRRTFSKNLRNALLEKGFSQSDIARKMWGNTPTGAAAGRDKVSTWVNGVALPNPGHLKELCDALGSEIEDLIPGGMHAAQSAETAPLKLTMTGEGLAHLEVNADLPSEAAIKIYEIVRKVNEARS